VTTMNRAAFAFVLVSGCASPMRFRVPEEQMPQARRDRALCETQAEAASDGGHKWARVYNKCMLALGYKPWRD
jgi:hypothetical protein